MVGNLSNSSKKPLSEKKQALVETAFKQFYANGFTSTGIDGIIADAGVAKMTLYKHFKFHQPIMVTVALMTLLGFLFILIEKDFTWSHKRHEYIHSILGIIVICLVFINVSILDMDRLQTCK